MGTGSEVEVFDINHSSLNFSNSNGKPYGRSNPVGREYKEKLDEAEFQKMYEQEIHSSIYGLFYGSNVILSIATNKTLLIENFSNITSGFLLEYNLNEDEEAHVKNFRISGLHENTLAQLNKEKISDHILKKEDSQSWSWFIYIYIYIVAGIIMKFIHINSGSVIVAQLLECHLLILYAIVYFWGNCVKAVPETFSKVQHKYKQGDFSVE
ncbi:hypothetical protein HYPBUDRAFT_153204 [Hyphopichia burtonii NRRL Y-1933]|uniref:Uncharacterized protein n=1 Tax=Hyphopichia burtonii NRRL Y-1933 TaxID=984485 RepID=A0A1E4RG81_9ASCO|nr:hypothetical protein HYPBUDRAFT_153204 [Hyphopichia burtonii NRRL Y-1933]ODV66263.1 hypothetical protein HYPBUDRAFT_153204 [Hyphopichia burtonii NRRL Y-1933]